MACNVPVIVSNTSSMPEVGGNAALLVDPNSPEDIAAKMLLLYNDEQLRKKLIQAAQVQKENFNWDTSAAQVWNCIKLAANNT
jgi:glycosyltransferase involved in cell wall biosynthesis